MKLWEIKAQALRLMFADTDVNFSYAEFSDGTIYSNSNTKEKLTRMNDSIARAIDMYYQYNREQTKLWSQIPLYYTYVITNNSTGLTYTLQTGETLNRDAYGVHTVLNAQGEVVLSDIAVVYTFQNYLDNTTKPSDFAYPTRVDLLKDKNYVNEQDNIEFYYDEATEQIYFHTQDFASYDSDTVKLALKFRVYYKIDITNIDTSASLSDLTTELNDLGIPADVQRMIPYFIKGEIYEEDEADIARAAKQEYINYIGQRPRNTFSKYQTKVKSYKRTRGE